MSTQAHWPQLGVGAVVCHQKALLLVKRARPPGQGLWAIPGGRVQPGETMQAAAEREIREETGVRIRAAGLAWQFEHIEQDPDGGLRFHYVVLDFYGEYLSGEPKAGDDASEARWVPFAELNGLALHPETARLLRSFYPEAFA
ncbi:MAG: NUDIX hydrolase [Chromatiales bacterium]|nr:NUDIX hydrolase [Gammaproteobacteria bacterium]MBW6477686.1 NUDIX hydrolase [Chromatiales bacterium]